MSNAGDSQGNTYSATSIDRWLGDGPQSNVHDRLVAGASPRPQPATDGAPLGVSHDLPTQNETYEPTSFRTKDEEKVHHPRGHAPEVVKSPTSHRETITRNGSTTSTLAATVREQKPRGSIISRITTWFSGRRRSRHSLEDDTCAESFALSGTEDTILRPETGGTQKRHRGRKGTSKSDSEEEKRSDAAKKQRKAVGEKKRRYACPFYQRHPDQNQRYPSCSGDGFEDIHRVKDHFRRCHWFNDNAEPRGSLRKHLPTERVTQSQWDAIKDLRKLARGKERTEKWNTMYSRLFPIDPNIPSAYVERDCRSVSDPAKPDTLHYTPEPSSNHGDLAGFKKFVPEKASRFVAKQLEKSDEPNTSGMNHEEKARVIKMFPSFVTGLLHEYSKDETRLAMENAGADGQGRTEGGSTANEAPPTVRRDLWAASGSEPPQLPPVTLSEPPGAIDMFANTGQACQVDKTQGAPCKVLPQGCGGRNPVTNLDGETAPNIYDSHPLATINPGVLSVDVSEDTSGYNQVFSSIQQSNNGPGAASFTTAPPQKANNQGDESEFDLWLEQILTNPGSLESDPFSFNYAPAQDAVGMDDDRGGHDFRAGSVANISPTDIADEI